MTRKQLADAFNLLAEAAVKVAIELEAIDTPSSEAAVEPGPAGANVSPPARSAAPADIPMKPQVDAGLSICPIHGIPWTVKAAGTTKAGKPYKAFWRCNERDADGFCSEKPQRIWQDTHPIREGAAA